VSLSLPFFERLAPTASGRSAIEFVRAALPPRFAASQDLDSGESLPLDIAADAEIVEHGTPQPLRGGEPGQQSGTAAALSDKDAVVVQVTPPSAKNLAAARASADPSPVRLPARTKASNTAAAVPATARSEHSPKTSNARRDKNRSADRDLLRKAPLSAAAQAQRVAASVERPTVVHVTIDRIDVRAPAAPAATERTPKKRSGAAQSLSDYLRQREQPNPAGRE
jgi:hypothetical protein